MPSNVNISEALPETLSNVPGTLVLVPGLHDARRSVCTGLLARSPDVTAAVGVVYRGTPTEWLSRWVDSAGGDREDARVVTAGGAAGESVRTVEAPSDLTGLEIAIGEALSAVGDAPAFCFDSLTAFLQYVDLSQAYQFLQVLVERLWRAGAAGHFHLDPDAHDERTIAALAPLFDAVVEVGPTDVAVKSRPGVLSA